MRTLLYLGVGAVLGTLLVLGLLGDHLRLDLESCDHGERTASLAEFQVTPWFAPPPEPEAIEWPHEAPHRRMGCGSFLFED